jgi:hypothetical protein
MPLESTRLRSTQRARLSATGLVACLAVTLSACTAPMLSRGTTPIEAPPVVDRAAASGAVIAGYLESMQKLVLSAPAEQAEAVAAAQREFELAPTPSHQLRFALILAVPGHTATDLPRAQRLLRELMASPAALLPAERALAFLEQQKVDAQLALSAENRRLQGTVVRNDKDRSSAANKRLQAEIDENARLRKELEAAQAKLDAISDIERSLSERKPSAESRPP